MILDTNEKLSPSQRETIQDLCAVLNEMPALPPDRVIVSFQGEICVMSTGHFFAMLDSSNNAASKEAFDMLRDNVRLLTELPRPSVPTAIVVSDCPDRTMIAARILWNALPGQGGEA